MLPEQPAEKPDPSAGWGHTPKVQPAAHAFHRKGLRAFWPEWCAASFYAALVAAAIPFHEPWADEAQAWQLARSLPLSDLFKTYIRYEGSPGLWHFLLWIFVRAHVGYTGLHWICGAIAVAATSLLVFASPLPRYLRLSLPFTYFLLFQYAVVARNYVLAPLLLFALAWFWKKNPFTVAVLLGLLANTSLHTAVISGGLAIVYATEHLRGAGSKDTAHRRIFLLCALIVLGFYVLAIWTAFPPHDLALGRVLEESRSAWVYGMISLTWGMCQPWGLSILFWIAVTAWFAARHKLLYLLPVVFFALFSGWVYANWWHVGLLVPLLVCLLWIAWPAPGPAASRFDAIGRCAMFLMIATQIAWSGYALVYDHSRPYSPDRDTAEFLRPLIRKGVTIAITHADKNTGNAFNAVGILPYFDRNIYANLKYPFWWWSNLDATETQFDQLLPSHPRIVLVEAVFKGAFERIPIEEPRYKSLLEAGYTWTQTFCGTLPERFEPALTNCHVIFEYPQAAMQSNTPPSTAPLR